MIFADTIFALSSGSLPSGVAVIRVSGRRSRFVCEMMLGQVPPARQATVMRIRDRAGDVIDQGLVTWFAGPASFTGEDCLELHLHGGRAVVGAAMRVLGGIDGLRPAEAGEFTRRAFGNGKLDLTQAEALGDLIAAETETQRRFAMQGAEGAQGELYRGWRARLVHARAMLEAELDFADEGDVPGSVSDSIWEDVASLKQEIERHVDGYQRAEMIRDGFDVVIVGAPNAGKSSLLNTLARRDVAIVSEYAGTTRDLIEVVLDLDGLKVRLTDTAGLRATDDAVERMGVDRARTRARHAHLLVALTDMSNPAPVDLGESLAPTIRVGTKADIEEAGNHDVAVSVRTGAGIDTLLSMIVDQARDATSGTDLMPSKLRHVACLEAAAVALDHALRGRGMALELRAEDLRLAGDSIGRITGEIGIEDLLGAIFSNFCIGK